MFQHNLLIAFRNLQRHKGSFFINLIGLSTGLACTFLIYLWVHDEMVFDKFHQNDSRLFQVMERSSENGNTIVHEATQGLLAESMVRDLPEVAASVPVMSLEKEEMYVPLKTAEKTVKATGIFAGGSFFSVFSFPLLQGTANSALKDKNAIVISEGLAQSLFGSASKAIGQSLEWELFGTKRQAFISGVFAALPANNSMKFDFALSYDLLLSDIAPNLQRWWNEGSSTYLLLRNGVDDAAFDRKITNFIQGYLKGSIFTLFTRPYSKAYLYGKYENGVQTGGRTRSLFSMKRLLKLWALKIPLERK
jgi:putative ABC transport system permease protein